MESEKQQPIYGSKEMLEQGVEAPKSDAFGVAENTNFDRLEDRLGGPQSVESKDTEQKSPEEVASRLGGTMLSGEVEDPRV